MLTSQQLTEIVLDAIRTINLSRSEEAQIDVSPDARLYGGGSGLDSLGLVSLVIEVEEGLRDHGIDVSLSNERAMSQKQSPYRDVPTLVRFIEETIAEQ